VAWGLGTEAPTAAEVQENIRQKIDLMRKPGTQAPVTAGTEHLRPVGYRGSSGGTSLFPR